MSYFSKWFYIIFIFVFGALTTEAHSNNNDMYAEDYAAMQSVLKPLLSTPTAQAKSWTGINGDGDIRVSLAISSSQGMPCQSISDCEKPCRNYTYTYVGERKDGWIINEERTGRLCYLGPRGWDLQSAETVRKSRKLNKSQRLIDAETAKKVEAEKEKIRKEQEARLEQERLRKEKLDRENRAKENADKERELTEQKERFASLVISIQSDLGQLKYNVGTPDGAFGQQTMNAINNFVRDANHGDTIVSQSPTLSNLELVKTILTRTVERQAQLVACGASNYSFIICAKIQPKNL